MPGTLGLITIPSDDKDAIICVDKMYQDTVVAEAATATVPTKENKGKKKDSRGASKESRKSTSPEHAAPVDDLPGSSNNKRHEVAVPQVKKVPAGLASVDDTFNISATLDEK